jgi:hypothetical protein
MGALTSVNTPLTDMRGPGFSKFHHEGGTNEGGTSGVGTDGPPVAFMRQMLARICGARG